MEGVAFSGNVRGALLFHELSDVLHRCRLIVKIAIGTTKNSSMPMVSPAALCVTRQESEVTHSASSVISMGRRQAQPLLRFHSASRRKISAQLEGCMFSTKGSAGMVTPQPMA